MLTGKLGKIVRITWACFLLVCIVLYVRYASYLSGENIASFILQYQNQVLGLYFILCILRGFTLIPSTPFLLAGIILFPTKPVLLLGVFLISQIITSAILYYISDMADLGHYFRKVHPEKMQKITEKINGKNGFWFILLWAFTPFTPTDLVCYVAGSLKMRFIQFILPLVCGEAIISALYIFNGSYLLQNIM